MHCLPIVPGLSDRQYVLVMRQLSNRMASGGNASIFLGTGLVFLQSRAYQPGDPLRSIDWRVMARTGRPHVKEYETQTHTPVFLIVDNSASMSFTAGEFSKYAIATLLAGGMAFTALKGGNPVSIMATSERACPQPTVSTNELTVRLQRLRYYSPQNANPLGAALAKMRESLTARSYVVVLSDLHDKCAARQIKSIALRHEVLAIQIADPLEAQPLRAGFVRLRAAESSQSGIVSDWGPLDQPPDQTEALKLAGAQVLRIQPERAFDPQVRAFLHKAALTPWQESKPTSR
jgi:uncharacterized protein (DUF58 family)